MSRRSGSRSSRRRRRPKPVLGGRSGRRPAGEVLRVRAPSDFLAVVPYLLGFHPTESLVCLFLHAGSHRFAMRADLPPAPGWAAGLADMLRRLADQHNTSELMVIAYTAAPDRARPELDRLVGLVERRGLVDLLVADGHRWWSLTCRRDCCPAIGTPYDLRSHPLAAQAVLAGLGVAPDRAALEAMTAGPDDAELPGLAELAGDLAESVCGRPRAAQMAEMADRVRRHLDAPGPVGDPECLRLALLGLHVQVRDVAWSLITAERADDHVDLWRRVVARTPPGLASAPLCLLGVAAWIAGNGALLNCCVDRMAEVDPSYSMAGLLAEISRRAVPPSAWEDIAGPIGDEMAAVADGAVDLEAAG